MSTVTCLSFAVLTNISLRSFIVAGVLPLILWTSTMPVDISPAHKVSGLLHEPVGTKRSMVLSLV